MDCIGRAKKGKATITSRKSQTILYAFNIYIDQDLLFGFSGRCYINNVIFVDIGKAK